MQTETKEGGCSRRERGGGRGAGGEQRYQLDEEGVCTRKTKTETHGGGRGDAMKTAAERGERGARDEARRGKRPWTGR